MWQKPRDTAGTQSNLPADVRVVPVRIKHNEVVRVWQTGHGVGLPEKLTPVSREVGDSRSRLAE